MWSKKFFFVLYIYVNITLMYIDVNCVDAPFIHIPGNGIISGTYLKMYRTQNIKAYLGIRYAHATRFSPPDVELPPWKGIYNATSFASNCWQQERSSSDMQLQRVLEIISGKTFSAVEENKYDEDCLYLNIFVPDGLPEVDGYAVIVWIHSGNFSIGSPMDIEPFQMVFKQKVIVVTFSYRLNIFGFLSTDDGEAQGNYGLMDQSAALYWIKRNINYFGGDENRITLMGHDAGAVSAALHMTSGEWSKGAFHKAILMSGNPLATVRLPHEHNNDLDKISNIFGCARRPTSMLVQCLKRVDPKIMTDNLPFIEWGPIVDFGLSNISYPFIENQPEVLFKAGAYHKVPIIIGITNMEEVLSLFQDHITLELTPDDLKSFFSDIAEKDIHKVVVSDEWCTNFQLISEAIEFMYSEESNNENSNNQIVINAHTEKYYLAPLQKFVDILGNHQSMYSYIFQYRSKSLTIDFPNWIGVPKYFDQIFVWGIPYMDKLIEWKSTDKKIADIIMTLWANFAKTSNPTKSNVYVKWGKITPPKYSLLLIDENFETGNLSNNHRMRFWSHLYPKVLQYASECCNSTNSGTTHTIKLTIKLNKCIFQSILLITVFIYFINTI